MKSFLKDRHEQINDHGDPDLRLHGVGRDAAGLDHHHDQGGQERGIGDRGDRRGVEEMTMS